MAGHNSWQVRLRTQQHAVHVTAWRYNEHRAYGVFLKAANRALASKREQFCVVGCVVCVGGTAVVGPLDLTPE